MKVLVLYHSQFGNTEKVARAIAAALESSNAVEVRGTGEGIADLSAFDLSFVGGPTQGHSASPSLKAALKPLSAGSVLDARVAVFDTRFNIKRMLSGSAASWAAKTLKSAGAQIVAGPESFFVTREKEPVLEPGEVERAAAWALMVAGAR